MALLACCAAAATAEARQPDAPLAARRQVRPETWVSRSRFHDGGDLKLTVSAVRADLYGRPQLGGAVIGVLRRGEVVSLVRRSHDGLWILVEIGGGDVAWIESRATEPGAARVLEAGPVGRSEATPASVRVPAAAPEVSRPAPRVTATKPGPKAVPIVAPVVARLPAPVVASVVEPEPEAQPVLAVSRRASVTSAHAFAVGARIGVAVISGRFVSNGTGALTNYDGAASGVAVTVGGGWVRAIGTRFRIGIDAGYSFAGGAAVRAHTSDGNSVVLGLQTHELAIGVAPGIHLSALGGLELRLRLGGFLQLNLVELQKQALLPSDRILGMTIGAVLAAPSLLVLRGHPLGLTLYAGVVAPADRVQTGNLEEGTASTTVGGQVGAELGIALRPGLGLSASYALSHLTTQFAGAARRNPAITSAERSNETHLASLGLTWRP